MALLFHYHSFTGRSFTERAGSSDSVTKVSRILSYGFMANISMIKERIN